MKAADVLQVVYSFFLGLVLVAVVGIGLDTFYPSPVFKDSGTAEWDEAAYAAHEVLWAAWALNTSIILLIAATLILLVSFVRSERHLVISNGLLLGGIFTMFYAVGLSLSSEQSLLRFVIVVIALAITVAVGWYKFSIKTAKKAAPAAATDPSTLVTDEAAGSPALDASEAAVLSARVAALENKMTALGAALLDGGTR